MTDQVKINKIISIGCFHLDCYHSCMELLQWQPVETPPESAAMLPTLWPRLQIDAARHAFDLADLWLGSAAIFATALTALIHHLLISQIDIDLALICLWSPGAIHHFYSVCWVLFPQCPKLRENSSDSETFCMASQRQYPKHVLLGVTPR